MLYLLQYCQLHIVKPVVAICVDVGSLNIVVCFDPYISVDIPTILNNSQYLVTVII